MSSDERSKITIGLPDWAEHYLADNPVVCETTEDRMRFVIYLAERNVTRQTGGPFGAGVFDEEGALVAAGVNLVVEGACSILHAEIVALALAQKALGRYDIGDGGRRPYELVTSAEPCAMCFGAIPWSGVSRLACGARCEDVLQIGFDEGPKLHGWIDALEARGIQVTRDILRHEAVAVLEKYVAASGPIYNPGAQDTATWLHASAGGLDAQRRRRKRLLGG